MALEAGALSCPGCSARYPIHKGIPQMLPPHLAPALNLKGACMEEIRASMLQGNRGQADSQEIERFMWEQQLYCWGKQVIYGDTRAAKTFSSYAEKGASGLLRFLQERVDRVKGKAILYVGSGNDRLVTLPLEEAGALVVNLDIAAEPLEDLMAAGARSCVCGDARRLPFPAESFDMAFSKGSIHHSHPIAEPLRAMARVVRRGGHIVVAEPNRYALFRLPRYLLPPKLRQKVGTLLRKRPGLGYPTPYEAPISATEVAQILRAEGISQIERATLTHAPPRVPSAIARPWETLGRSMPRLFSRFAFEFIVYGRKTWEE